MGSAGYPVRALVGVGAWKPLVGVLRIWPGRARESDDGSGVMGCASFQTPASRARVCARRLCSRSRSSDSKGMKCLDGDDVSEVDVCGTEFLLFFSTALRSLFHFSQRSFAAGETRASWGRMGMFILAANSIAP
jgi:hypothetical protein